MVTLPSTQISYYGFLAFKTFPPLYNSLFCLFFSKIFFHYASFVFLLSQQLRMSSSLKEDIEVTSLVVKYVIAALQPNMVFQILRKKTSLDVPVSLIVWLCILVPPNKSLHPIAEWIFNYFALLISVSQFGLSPTSRFVDTYVWFSSCSPTISTICCETPISGVFRSIWQGSLLCSYAVHWNFYLVRNCASFIATWNRKIYC